MDWKVVARGSRYYAVSKRHRRIRVPLEMAGEGQPRLLEWEIKRRPLSGIGTLRFSAGVVAGPKGPEKVEQVAILDLQGQNFVESILLQGQSEWHRCITIKRICNGQSVPGRCQVDLVSAVIDALSGAKRDINIK